jgi:signal transduction histidine kinase/ActR/RegA family two-component response regulator
MKAFRRSLKHRLALLIDASTLLGSGLLIEHALPRLARLAVPWLGDLCAIDLVQEDGALARVAGTHVDPAKEALVTELRSRHGFNPASPAGVPAAVRARRTVLVARVTDADLMAEAQNADQLRLLQRLGPRSWLIVPLIGRARVLGAITLAITESGRRYGRADEGLAAAVAGQAAAAIEIARLRHDAETARSAAESASRARDEFLATLSHELRNPLNAMLGWARLLESGKLDEEQARRAVRIILRNVDAQVRLVDDLLDVSSVVSGRMRLALQVVDLRGVIEEVLDSVRAGAAAKGVRLHALVESPGVPISGDPDRLRQVVWNLLSNAVKFTPSGGRVEIKARRVRSHAEMVVADTGQGIHADVLPHVFDPLRQGDGTTTRTHGGTGLGLALVRHLVELHGGSVFAESMGEGQGATFVVKLPLLVAGAREHPFAPSEPSAASAVSLAGVRVLVVDDDPVAVDMVVAMLVQSGAAARGSDSVASALRTVAQWRPDVLISDVEMPGEDGYTLIRRLRALSPDAGGKTPAVALTAFNRSEDRIRSFREGFSIHLSKPVDPDELILVIANLAGRVDQGSTEAT